jgi:Fur family zinc uptake transcriptional regulator
MSRPLTRNQALVHGALTTDGGPLSAYTLLDRLRDDGFRAPLQVYRALEQLMAQGLVHRLESLNAFVACKHPACGRHGVSAFAICGTCGAVLEFTDQVVEARLESWAKDHKFNADRTTIELRGQCAECTK